MRDFKKYDVWKNSHKLTLKIFNLTQILPPEEKYRLISQVLRAAYSIPSNIAEGCGRQSDKEFDRFLQISLGSAHELEYFIILLKDLYYIDEKLSISILEDINFVKKQPYSLSQKLKSL